MLSVERKDAKLFSLDELTSTIENVFPVTKLAKQELMPETNAASQSVMVCRHRSLIRWLFHLHMVVSAPALPFFNAQ